MNIEAAVEKLMKERRIIDAMETGPDKTRLRRELLNEFEKAIMYLLPFAQMANMGNRDEQFGYPEMEEDEVVREESHKNLFLGRD